MAALGSLFLFSHKGTRRKKIKFVFGLGNKDILSRQKSAKGMRNQSQTRLRLRQCL